MRAQGAGAPGTIGAAVQVTLVESAEGGTELTYDADATVGGMIGGVGQRMLTGVSKKLAAEFFDNVDALLAAGVAAAAGPGPGAAGGLPGQGGATGPSGLAALGLPPVPTTVAPLRRVSPSAVAPPWSGVRRGRSSVWSVARWRGSRAGGDRVHAACGVASVGGPAGAPGFVVGVVVGGGGGARGRGRRRVAHGAEARRAMTLDHYSTAREMVAAVAAKEVSARSSSSCTCSGSRRPTRP